MDARPRERPLGSRREETPRQRPAPLRVPSRRDLVSSAKGTSSRARHASADGFPAVDPRQRSAGSRRAEPTYASFDPSGDAAYFIHSLRPNSAADTMIASGSGSVHRLRSSMCRLSACVVAAASEPSLRACLRTRASAASPIADARRYPILLSAPAALLNEHRGSSIAGRRLRSGCFRSVSDVQQLLASRAGRRGRWSSGSWDRSRCGTEVARFPVGGPKPRALLAVLLLHPNEVVSADRLIDELWGEESPEAPPPHCGSTSRGFARRFRRTC